MKRLTLLVFCAVGIGSIVGVTSSAWTKTTSNTNTFTAATSFCSGTTDQYIQASADSWVNQASAGTNYGNDTTLYVASQNSNRNRRTFVKFDLPDKNGCTVKGAALGFFSTNYKSGRTLQAYNVAAAWTETGITWTNQPTTSGTAITTSSGTTSGYMGWPDVTSIVNAHYTGPNNGFMVKDATESQPSANQQIFTSRTGQSDQRPILWLTLGP